MKTYKQIFKELDNAGLIEKILVETNFDRIGLMRGIEYVADFVGSGTFNGMTYWADRDESKRTIRKVENEYAKLQIKKYNAQIEKFKYMATATEF